MNAPEYSPLATRMAKTKAGKSAGTDGIVGEIHRIAPQQTAKTLWPIIANAGWTFSMPLSTRGGQLVELWKGKGSQLECGSYRDINLKDLLGKD